MATESVHQALREALVEAYPDCAEFLDFDPEPPAGFLPGDPRRHETHLGYSVLNLMGVGNYAANAPRGFLLFGLLPEVRLDGRFPVVVERVVEYEYDDEEHDPGYIADIPGAVIAPTIAEVAGLELHKKDPDMVAEFLQAFGLELGIGHKILGPQDGRDRLIEMRDDPAWQEIMLRTGILMESMRAVYEGRSAGLPQNELSRRIGSIIAEWFEDRAQGEARAPKLIASLSECFDACEFNAEDGFGQLVEFTQGLGIVLAEIGEVRFRDNFGVHDDGRRSDGQSLRERFMYTCAAILMDCRGQGGPGYFDDYAMFATSFMGHIWRYANDAGIEVFVPTED